MPDVVYSEWWNNSFKRAYTYDTLGRVKTVKSQATSGWLTDTYTYLAISGKRSSSLVSSLATPAGTFSYTYDDRGNIASVSDGTYLTTYTYDNLNQLVREDNEKLGKTYIYSYLNGNITSRKEYAYTLEAIADTATAIKTDTYEYSAYAWGDLLVKALGKSLTYTDGEITKLNGKNLTWGFLGKLTSCGDTSFTYDTSGRRLSKTTGSTTTDYYYAGDMLVGQKTGSDKIEFMFDSGGDYYGFEYNDTPYYYIKNLQGDVIAIFNDSGTQVATYTYDAWGRILATTDTSGINIATINPIRYRSYYYDTETGYYYLNARYYFPEICRFISPDGAISDVAGDIRGYNQFAYCFNNPVNMSDDSGNWPSWATKVIIGTVVIAAAAALTVATAGTGTALACFAVGALKGALICAAIGAASGAVTGAVNHRVTTGSWEGAGEAALEGAADGYMTGAITGFVSGGLTSNVCFVAGTEVLTSNGNTVIEEIKVGDYVWAGEPVTNEKAIKKVVQTFVNETTELIHIKVENEEIICTNEHPFYSPTKGWTAAYKLRAGDILVTVNGEYVVIEKVQHEILESPVKVYNFEVKDFHTYFVSTSSVLVHNVCQPYNQLTKTTKGTGLQAHHIIEKRFANILGVNQNTMLSTPVTPAEHQIFTSAWRQAIPYGTSSDINTIWNTAQTIYANNAELLEAARITLFGG